MSGADDAGDLDETTQEDVTKQRILAQKKEKKIKIIRILTVIAYLISVSAVAATLSAYYVFIWNPHAGNRTELPNAEGIVMALQRAKSEYVFANAADREYSETGKFMPAMLNSHKSGGGVTRERRPIQYQTATVRPSTTVHVRSMADNVSQPFTETNKNS